MGRSKRRAVQTAAYRAAPPTQEAPNGSQASKPSQSGGRPPKPDFSDLLREAKTLHRSGRLAEAQRVYLQILQVDDQNPEALHYLGLLKHQQGDGVAAVDLMYRAVTLKPDSSEFHCNLGMILGKSGRLQEALEVLDRAIELKPRSTEAYDNRGIVLEKQGKGDEAIAAWRKAIEIEPDYPPALTHLGRALLAKDQAEEGLELLRKSVKANPHSSEAQNQLGCALRKVGELEAAAEAFRRAIQLDPCSCEAHSNLGIALYDLGELDQSLVHAEKAVELKSDYAEAHWNLSLTLLAMGAWERGWIEYEWRRYGQIKKGWFRSFQQPEWNGCPIEGRTILLTAEQGFGDTLQFIRYAPLVAARGAKVIVEAPPALCEILRGVKGVSQIVALGEPLPPFDLHTRLLTLPCIFGTRPTNVPAEVPYLHADPRREALWKPRMTGGQFKIGIAWQGNTSFGNDRLRSIPLKNFELIARVEGVKLFSLQKNAGTEQLAQVADRFRVEQFNPPLDEGGSGAFTDTAAVMNQLDLVITSDTSVAHLAGALGVRVWVALGVSSDWRWLRDRDDTPWYPTMRLFRQQRPGDWEGVFDRIAKALRDTLGSLPSEEPEPVMAPLAPGELIDRLTILQIKSQRVKDPVKLRTVRHELETLAQLRDRSLPHGEQLEALARELRSVNEVLWQVEDDIRAADAAGDFGPRFVELAQSVYRNNDRRAEFKRKINLLLGSSIRDEKHYQPYGKRS